MLAAFEFGQTYSKGTTKQKWNLWKPSISGSKNTNFTELLQRYVETTGVWTFFIWLVKNWAANEIEISYYYYEKQLIKKMENQSTFCSKLCMASMQVQSYSMQHK